MAWTTPRTWIPGELVTALMMNTHVRDNMNYLFSNIGAVDLSGKADVASPTFTGIVTLGGGQLKFPASQNASTDVNTLDDYEEGSWTPVIGGNSGTSGQTYSTQNGRYTKIGKLVTCFGTCVLTAKGTITGTLQVQGLPFTSDAVSYGIATFYWSGMTSSLVTMIGTVPPGGTTTDVEGNTAAGTAATTLSGSDVSNASTFVFMITYRSAS